MTTVSPPEETVTTVSPPEMTVVTVSPPEMAVFVAISPDGGERECDDSGKRCDSSDMGHLVDDDKLPKRLCTTDLQSGKTRNI